VRWSVAHRFGSRRAVLRRRSARILRTHACVRLRVRCIEACNSSSAFSRSSGVVDVVSAARMARRKASDLETFHWRARLSRRLTVSSSKA
jgi:hypothetical protein